MLRHCRDSGSDQAAPLPATMASSTTFSLFFPMMPKAAAQWPPAVDALDDDRSSVTTSPSSPSSSTGSVDCTLSLGTPSSRRAADPAKRAARPPYPSPPSATASWDVVAAAAADQPYYCCQGSSRPAAAAKVGAARADHDPLLLDRRCANCGTASTPLWRNGPRGPKSLCNACGIRFKKEERRAAATAAAAAMDQAGCGYVAQRAAQYGMAPPPPGAVAYCDGAFPCDVADAAEAPPLLAWRLSVVAPPPAPAFAVWPPERTTLFQYN